MYYEFSSFKKLVWQSGFKYVDLLRFICLITLKQHFISLFEFSLVIYGKT